MSLDATVHILVVLIIFGLVWWLLQTYVLPKVAEPFRTIIIVILVLLLVFWLLGLVGIVPLRM